MAYYVENEDLECSTCGETIEIDEANICPTCGKVVCKSCSEDGGELWCSDCGEEVTDLENYLEAEKEFEEDNGDE